MGSLVTKTEYLFDILSPVLAFSTECICLNCRGSYFYEELDYNAQVEKYHFHTSKFYLNLLVSILNVFEYADIEHDCTKQYLSEMEENEN